MMLKCGNTDELNSHFWYLNLQYHSKKKSAVIAKNSDHTRTEALRAEPQQPRLFSSRRVRKRTSQRDVSAKAVVK